MVRPFPVDDQGHGVHGIPVNADIKLYQIRMPDATNFVIHRRIPAADRLQPVIKVKANLVEGQFVKEHNPFRPEISDLFLRAPFFLAEPEDVSQVLLRDVDGG